MADGIPTAKNPPSETIATMPPSVLTPQALMLIGEIIAAAVALSRSDDARALWHGLTSGASPATLAKGAEAAARMTLDVAALEMHIAALQLELTTAAAVRTIDDNLRAMGWSEAQIANFLTIQEEVDNENRATADTAPADEPT